MAAQKKLAEEDLKIDVLETRRRVRVKQKLEHIQHSFATSELDEHLKVMDYLENERSRNALEQKMSVDLDGDGDTGQMGMTAEEIAEERRLALELKQRDAAAVRAIKEERDLAEARKVAAAAQDIEADAEEVVRKREAEKERLFSHDHVMKAEFEILLAIVSEMTEFVVPVGVTILECWLYFGWNRNALPVIGALTITQFLQSAGAKLFIAVLQYSVHLPRWPVRYMANFAKLCYFLRNARGY